MDVGGDYRWSAHPQRGRSPVPRTGPKAAALPSRLRKGGQEGSLADDARSEADALPRPLAGGDRGVGARFRLDRPTALVRKLRGETNEIEAMLWTRLRRSQLGGFKFSRQIPVAGFVPDFVCRPIKLAIELDGSQHADAVAYDINRTKLIERQGYRVLRFWNSDVLTNMDGMLETILSEALATSGAPTPQPPPACGRGS